MGGLGGMGDLGKAAFDFLIPVELYIYFPLSPAYGGIFNLALSHKGRGKRSCGVGCDTGVTDLTGIRDGRF